MQFQRGPAARRPLALLGTAAFALAAPSVAAAANVDRVCAPRANLYETPGGLQIGVIAEGRSVIVLRRTAAGRWIRVRTNFGARGWVKSRLLCDEGAE